MMPEKTLFIYNGASSVGDCPAIGGGAVRWIEIAKKWQSRGIEIHVLTGNVGVCLCRRLGLDAVFHVMPFRDKYSFGSFVERLLEAPLIPISLKKFEGVIYSATELSYDVLPAVRLKKMNPKNIWACVIHWVAPLIRTGTTAFNSSLFFVNQRIGLYLAKRYSDLIFAVSEPTADQLLRTGFSRSKVHPVACGVDYHEVRKIISSSSILRSHKDYDAVFMKRFDVTKGIFDVIEIWSKVVKKNPLAKLLLVGPASQHRILELRRLIETYELSKNVEISHPVYDFEKKFAVLGASKLLILPSYEENWALIIGEAMAAGVPVICYKLKEIEPIWKNHVQWIPKGNQEEFAKQVVGLLEDDDKRKMISVQAQKFVQQYSWKEIASNEWAKCLAVGA
jgi:glycosyltransferase involved in cell wall biosynthesis